MKRKSCTPMVAASMAALVALSGLAAKPLTAEASPFGQVQLGTTVPSTSPQPPAPSAGPGGGSSSALEGAAVIAYGECGAEDSNVFWEFYDCGVLIISGTGAMADFQQDSASGSTNAPWIAQGFGQSIEDIVISSGVTNVGDYAFAGCAVLESVQLPDSLAQIGLNAFENCSGLKAVAIPSCNISDRAFSGCGSLSAIYFDGVSGLNGGQNGIHPFDGLTATAYYRASDSWTDSNREILGDSANLTWVALDDGEFESKVEAETLGKYGDLSDSPSSGAQQSGSWQKNDIGWWWQYSDGTYPVLKWELINGNWYYFDSIGYMATGWQFVDGYWYYLGGADDGAMKTGWQQVGGIWYFMYPNGAMASDTYIDDYYVDASGAWVHGADQGQSGGSSVGAGSWIQSGDLWWYRHANGSYTTNGWEFINGEWYYFDAAGWMVRGWQQVNGLWYYMDESGAMLTGWLQLGDTWYYLNDNGAMAADTWIGDDYVDASGVWVPDASAE